MDPAEKRRKITFAEQGVLSPPRAFRALPEDIYTLIFGSLAKPATIKPTEGAWAVCKWMSSVLWKLHTTHTVSVKGLVNVKGRLASFPLKKLTIDFKVNVGPPLLRLTSLKSLTLTFDRVTFPFQEPINPLTFEWATLIEPIQFPALQKLDIPIFLLDSIPAIPNLRVLRVRRQGGYDTGFRGAGSIPAKFPNLTTLVSYGPISEVDKWSLSDPVTDMAALPKLEELDPVFFGVPDNDYPELAAMFEARQPYLKRLIAWDGEQLEDILLGLSDLDERAQWVILHHLWVNDLAGEHRPSRMVHHLSSMTHFARDQPDTVKAFLDLPGFKADDEQTATSIASGLKFSEKRCWLPLLVNAAERLNIVPLIKVRLTKWRRRYIYTIIESSIRAGELELVKNLINNFGVSPRSPALLRALNSRQQVLTDPAALRVCDYVLSLLDDFSGEDWLSNCTLAEQLAWYPDLFNKYKSKLRFDWTFNIARLYYQAESKSALPSLECLSYIMEQPGIDPNALTGFKYSALSLLASRSDAPAVDHIRLLLKHGAIADSPGVANPLSHALDTPLFLNEGSEVTSIIVKELVLHGADVVRSRRSESEDAAEYPNSSPLERIMAATATNPDLTMVIFVRMMEGLKTVLLKDDSKWEHIMDVAQPLLHGHPYAIYMENALRFDLDD